MYTYMDMTHDFGGTAEETSVNGDEALPRIQESNSSYIKNLKYGSQNESFRR